MLNTSTLQKGLIFHAPLDGEHQAKDVTPYGNHGTINGATLSTGRKGEANGAYDFINGSVTYIDCGNSPETNFETNDNFSLSYWIYLPRIVSTTTVKHGSASVAGYYDRVDTNGLFRFMINYNGGTYWTQTANREISANQWYFITIKKEGNYIYIYINGIEKVVNRPFIKRMDLSVENLVLGMYSPTDSPSIGKLSDFRIYNRALEEDEIKLLYESYKPKISTSSLEKGLVGHWMLDSENGAKDLTPYGNHGTINGATLSTGRKGEANGSYSFDGVGDYMKLPSIQMKSISMWVKIPSSQARWFYLLDARDGLKLGYIGSVIGIDWDILYINGISVPVSWDSIPKDTWTHLYFQTGNLFTDDLNIMSRYTNNEFLAGSISDVRIYNRALSEDEIKLLYDQYKPKGSANVGSLQKGLVLDMPLTTKHTKSATIVADRTPYGNDGTVSGATVGSDSTSFDGVDDYIEIPHNSNQLLTTGGSISVWINPKSLGESNKGRVIDKSTGISGNDGFFFSMYGTNAVNFRISTTINLTTSSNSVPYDTWTHILATWNSSGYIKTYINGILNIEGQGSNPSLITTTNPLTIGNRATATDRTFKGQISNIKIYNRALEEDEIKLLWEKVRY